MKWFRYKIDYEYGNAELWTKERQEDPLGTFYSIASECFGIRKSIGETKLLDEELLEVGDGISSPKSTDDQIMKMGGGDLGNTMLHAMINQSHDYEISPEQLEKLAYILTHSGGDLAGFTEDKDPEGNYWKLLNEWGEVCSCKKYGVAQLSCEVHHFWTKDHEKVCKEKH